MRTVIVNINLEYEVDTDDELKAIEYVENVELPSGYVSDSFEIVKILDEEGNEKNL